MKKRTYPTFPIPSVGAVILKNDHILLIQRGQAPAKGKWTLPGGVVELGEAPEEALIREVKEECNLIITVVGVLDVVNKVLLYGLFPFIDLIFFSGHDVFYPRVYFSRCGSHFTFLSLFALPQNAV